MSGRGTCPQCQGSGWIQPSYEPTGRRLCPSCGTTRPEPVAPGRGGFLRAVVVVVGVVVAVAVLSNAGGWLEPVLNPSAANNPSWFSSRPDRGYLDDPDAEIVEDRVVQDVDCGPYGEVTVTIVTSYQQETDVNRDGRRAASAQVTFHDGNEQLGQVAMDGYVSGDFLTLAAAAEAGEGPRDLVPMHLTVEGEQREIWMNNSRCGSYITPRD